MQAVTFLDLEVEPSKFSHQEISIKGFYYESEIGKPILSSLPNLKTCCLEKKGNQIFLDKKFTVKQSKSITVKGFLNIESDRKFSLKNSEILSEPNDFSIIFISILITFIFFIYYLFNIKKNRSKIL